MLNNKLFLKLPLSPDLRIKTGADLPTITIPPQMKKYIAIDTIQDSGCIPHSEKMEVS